MAGSGDPATAVIKPWPLALGGMLAMAGAVGIGRFIYTPILPAMSEGLGLTKGEAGLLASANYLGYLLGALLAGAAFLPGGARLWLLSMLATGAATTGAMAMEGLGGRDGLSLYIALRFLGGVASAYGLVLASTLVLERLSAIGRSGLSALHFAGVGVGIALSALITWGVTAGLLDPLGGDWRAMWLGGALLSFVALLGVALLVPGRQSMDTAAREPPAPRAGARLWVLVVAYGLVGFGYVITATFIIAIVRGAEGLRPIEPVIWLVVGLVALPSVAIWGALGRRYGVLTAFALAALVEAVGVVASVVWVNLVGLMIAAIFLGGTFMALTALGLIAARDLGGGNPRRAIAVMTAAFGLGQVIGPLVAGYAFDATGSFLGSSLAAAAALCLSALLAQRLKQTAN